MLLSTFHPQHKPTSFLYPLENRTSSELGIGPRIKLSPDVCIGVASALDGVSGRSFQIRLRHAVEKSIIAIDKQSQIIQNHATAGMEAYGNVLDDAKITRYRPRHSRTHF